MHRLDLLHNLKHLFFAVAGGFSNDQVRKVKVGAGISRSKAVRTLNQGAQVARQILFSRRYWFVSGAA